MPYSNQTVSMNKTEKKIAQAAERFAKRWEGKGYEKGESQLFWTELLKAHRDIVARLFTLYTQLTQI